MNWATFEDTLQAQIRYAAFRGDGSYTNKACIWAHQTADRARVFPAGDGKQLVVLKLQSSTVIGEGQRDSIDNPDAEPGSEILLRSSQHVEIILQVEVISKAAFGNDSAMAIAFRAKNYLEQSAPSAVLAAEGIFIIEQSTIQHVPRVLETSGKRERFLIFAYAR